MVPSISNLQRPEEGIISDLYDRKSRYTPDFKELKKKDLHLVFLYGRLRMGPKTAEFFKGCPYLGEGHTPADTTVRLSPTGVPLAFPGNTIVGEKFVVTGDVWALTPVQMLGLDKVLGNGDQLQRKLKYVCCHDQQIKAGFRPYLHCWMYMGNPERYRGVYLTSPKHSGYNSKGVKIFDALGKESNLIVTKSLDGFDFGDDHRMH